MAEIQKTNRSDFIGRPSPENRGAVISSPPPNATADHEKLTVRRAKA
jgi:hypothetical protein